MPLRFRVLELFKVYQVLLLSTDFTDIPNYPCCSVP